MIYFDNNANIPMPDEVLKSYAKGAKLGNISNQSGAANIGKYFMRELTKQLEFYFPGMRIIFTSGGSEGNSTVIRKWRDKHCVCSMVEHSSVIAALEGMNVSWVRPQTTGHISVDDLLISTRENTGLIIMQSTNSETGAIQDLMKLAVNNKRRIAIHCDHVQGFMKLPEMVSFVKYCNQVSQPLTVSISFHKIGGPVGFGALMTNTEIVPLIAGTQNHGLRGGTYNAAAICATHRAMQLYDYNKVKLLRNKFNEELAKHYIIVDFPQLMNILNGGANVHSNGYVVLFSCGSCLPHTIFMAISHAQNKILCNMFVREVLSKHGIVVGLGSACNTEIEHNTNGMNSADIPLELKKGFIRISLSCYNTMDEIKKLVKALAALRNYD